MRRLTIGLFLSVWLFSGCASYEGRYSPDCMALAGSTVELANGRFEWDRFTDEVRLDDDGNAIDQFPDYPKRGTFRRDGQALIMNFESGAPAETMYLHSDQGQYFLLSSEQFESLGKDGKPERCALKLGGYQPN